jgi:hypothetical protein
MNGLKYDINYNGILFSYKMDKILSLVATWMRLKNSMLNEISWAQKGKYQILIHCRS